MTKVEQITESLKNEISNGTYPPGSKLPSEAVLCQTYQVSRTSIRSAIHSLVAEGIIETYQGKGSFISTRPSLHSTSIYISPANRLDMFEFRRIFEVECVALAALRADESILARMKQTIAYMQNTTDPEETVKMDMEFHYLVAKATGNTIMAEIFNMMKPQYEKMFIANVAMRKNDGYKEHLQIVSAIESRNPETARQYMAQHLNYSMMQDVVNSYMDDKPK